MTTLKPIYGQNALRNWILARLIDFMAATTDDDVHRALEALMNFDDIFNYHGTLHVLDKK